MIVCSPFGTAISAGEAIEIFRHKESLPHSLAKPVLTIGNFDGVHLGHQALIRNVVTEARACGARSAVLTFEPHPLQILAPGRAPRLMLTHKDKMRLLQSFEVDAVIVQKFDRDFANIEAENFVRQYLVEQLDVRKVWVGRNFGFGKEKRGRVEDLCRWGKEAGFEVGVVEPIVVSGVSVSSSRIRSMVEQGEVHRVKAFLNRYHFISGRVQPGHQRGRSLGFPTANVVPQTEVIPGDGIYATLIDVGGRSLKSATSVGRNPTFGEGPRTIESFIMDFEGDLYGEPVRLFFVNRIREERKFDSKSLLVNQIRDDVARAEEILSGIDPRSSSEEK